MGGKNMLKAGKAGFISSLTKNDPNLFGCNGRMREKCLIFLP